MSTLHVPGDTRHPWRGLLRRAGPAAVEHALPDVPYGEDQDTIHVRGEYVPDTLMIGEYDDGVYLLNPHVRTPDGEWEAWYMAPWLAGAERCRSFWDLMNNRLREYARPS
ncbi:hypothetical protein ACWDR1_25980 [Streptosporangium sandarakinum]